MHDADIHEKHKCFKKLILIILFFKFIWKTFDKFRANYASHKSINAHSIIYSNLYTSYKNF